MVVQCTFTKLHLNLSHKLEGAAETWQTLFAAREEQT